MAAVEVLSLNKNSVKFEKRIKRIATLVLRHFRKENFSLAIYLISDRKMKFLNKKFLGKNKSTDVLSFIEPKSFVYPPGRFKRLGEIYLNIPLIERQSGANFEVALSRPLIHGFLHLLGYTHRRKNDRIKMEKQEVRLLGLLNHSVF